MKVEVVNYTKYEKGGALLGFVELKFPDIGLSLQCKHFKSSKGGEFIGLPSQKQEVNGEIKYKPLAFIHEDHYKDFQKSALDAITGRQSLDYEAHTPSNMRKEEFDTFDAF